MTAPRVSVLMNSRNATEFLPDAIRSVLWQSEADLELILCEASDGEEGVRIAAAFNDPRLIVLRDFDRLGWAHGVNVSFARSRGRYVSFMAGDDILHPRCFERMAAALDATGAGTAVVPVRAIDEHSVPTGRTVVVPEDVRAEPTWARHFERNYIIFALTRRDCLPLPPIDESIRGVGGDWHLWLRLIAAGTGFCYVDELLFDYRVHGGSLVAQQADTRTDMRAVLSSFDDQIIEGCYRRAGFSASEIEQAKLWIAISRGQLGDALARSRELEASAAADPRWRFQTATLLLLLGQHDEAHERLLACALSTDAPEAWNNLGVAAQRRGCDTDAIAHFERALTRWPDYKDARRNLDATRATWVTERPLRPLDQIVR